MVVAVAVEDTKIAKHNGSSCSSWKYKIARTINCCSSSRRYEVARTITVAVVVEGIV